MYKAKRRSVEGAPLGVEWFLARKRLGFEAEEVLLMDLVGEAEFGFDLFEGSGVCFDDVVNEVAFGQFFAAVGELAFPEVVDLLEASAFEFHIAADFTDDGIDSVFFAAGVENDEAFILALHFRSRVEVSCPFGAGGWVCFQKD